jgi:type VI secretion system protein ImpF
MPEIAGAFASNVDLRAIERGVRQAIETFEPRILARTIQVTAIVSDEDMDHNALTFQIEGELWAQPVPEKLLLKTEIDLETGAVSVTEQPGRRSG